MKQYTVIRAYRAAFENPIKTKAGERVLLGMVDQEYPAWIWCITDGGNSGWAPLEYLQFDGSNGVFIRDYDATELTVMTGAQLTELRDVGGWVLCQTKAGEIGWVPKVCVVSSADGKS